MNSSNSPPARRGCRRGRKWTSARWARAGPETRPSPCCVRTAFPSALLDLGGNVQALGSKADGSAWRVGIIMPEDQTNFCVLEVRDAAVVTSGNYERFFTADDGAVYGHILDPRTGAPVENGLKSVTVIGAEGKKCDALSTALFVMGKDAAIDHCGHTGTLKWCFSRRKTWYI